MNAYQVPVTFCEEGRWIYLREVRGADEMAVAETGTRGALDLLNRLLLDVPETAIPGGQAADLTTADRDRALAAIYRNTYGDHIVSTIHCQACDAPFDLDFSLSNLQEHLYAEEQAIPVDLIEDGYFRLPDGRSFRLPTGRDECSIQGLSIADAEQELLTRCLPDGNAEETVHELQQVMQQIAPVINLEVEAACPECGHTQTLRFDIQQYLLSSLLQEQRQLAYEVHQLAKAYGWGLNEILELPRSIRRMYVALIESEQ